MQVSGRQDAWVPAYLCWLGELPSSWANPMWCTATLVSDPLQVMKTYHMYNADSISAQSKLKEAEKQEEKQIGKSVKQEEKQTPRSPDSTSNVKFEEKHVRRSSVKKIEKMKEKVLPLHCCCLCKACEEETFAVAQHGGLMSSLRCGVQMQLVVSLQVLSIEIEERQKRAPRLFLGSLNIRWYYPRFCRHIPNVKTGSEYGSNSCLLGSRGERVVYKVWGCLFCLTFMPA